MSQGALPGHGEVMGTAQSARRAPPVAGCSLVAVLILATLSGCTSPGTSPSPPGPPSRTSVSTAPSSGEPSSGSAIRFLLHDTYAVGDTARVKIENIGDRPYRYQLSYAACSLRYFDGDGRRFIIPPGTHCDIISHGTINPGQMKPLFNWKLDECVRDEWGCVRSEPLSPGTYTITGLFKPESAGKNVRASGSFELLSA